MGAELITEPPGTPGVAPPQAAPVQRQRASSAPIPESPINQLLGGMGGMPALVPQYKAAREGLEKSRAGMADAATKRDEASAPLRERVTELNKAAPAAPTLNAIPEGFQHYGLTNESMTDAMQTMFMFAAIGGALTRQPMTAAMNAFAGGMKGLAQGDQALFAREMQAYDRNLKTAIAKNDEMVQKYKLALGKNEGDVQRAMNELKLISTEYQDKATAAAIDRQDFNGTLQRIEGLVRAGEQARKEDQRHAEVIKRMDAEAARHAATAAETKRFHDEQIKRWGLDRDSKEKVAAERLALKAKADGQGGKPSATERQHYMDSNRLVKDVERVEGMLKDPALKAKVDAQQLGGILSDTVESKLIQQYLVRPNLDPDVKNYLTAVNLLRNQYYLDQSGKAVTGGEALRNYGAVVQPGDVSDDTLRKMEIMKSRAGERMTDYETYFPVLGSIRGGRAPGAAPAAGGVMVDGYRFPNQGAADRYSAAKAAESGGAGF